MKKQLPKNVRQIGNVSDSSKIYVEDYVDTFFNQLCDKTDQMPIGAFFGRRKSTRRGSGFDLHIRCNSDERSDHERTGYPRSGYGLEKCM